MNLNKYFLDPHLRWDKQIEYIVNKTKYLIFMFHKMARYMANLNIENHLLCLLPEHNQL